ncbi:hypothetical protein BJ508DRAFT_366332 [Ascobolus immersus RN42]|uniref:Uncharacterized protein n=1 Tax=Ascobolus immersus RN42 TaxID=1160509 RepID=A0A3N4HP48_ASCIM|nr:hypothetical protein BJ508DRAFT_366332 [Ascobolus immersus RN42]
MWPVCTGTSIRPPWAIFRPRYVTRASPVKSRGAELSVPAGPADNIVNPPRTFEEPDFRFQHRQKLPSSMTSSEAPDLRTHQSYGASNIYPIRRWFVRKFKLPAIPSHLRSHQKSAYTSTAPFPLNRGNSIDKSAKVFEKSPYVRIDDIQPGCNSQLSEVERSLNESLLVGKPINLYELYSLHWNTAFTEAWRKQRCCITLLPLGVLLWRLLALCTEEKISFWSWYYDYEEQSKYQKKMEKFRGPFSFCICTMEEQLAIGSEKIGSLVAVQIDAEGMLRKAVRMIRRWTEIRLKHSDEQERVEQRLLLQLTSIRNAQVDLLDLHGTRKRYAEQRWNEEWERSVLRARRRERLWEEALAVSLPSSNIANPIRSFLIYILQTTTTFLVTVTSGVQSATTHQVVDPDLLYSKDYYIQLGDVNSDQVIRHVQYLEPVLDDRPKRQKFLNRFASGRRTLRKELNKDLAKRKQVSQESSSHPFPPEKTEAGIAAFASVEELGKKELQDHVHVHARAEADQVALRELVRDDLSARKHNLEQSGCDTDLPQYQNMSPAPPSVTPRSPPPSY